MSSKGFALIGLIFLCVLGFRLGGGLTEGQLSHMIAALFGFMAGVAAMAAVWATHNRPF